MPRCVAQRRYTVFVLVIRLYKLVSAFVLLTQVERRGHHT